MTHRYTPPNHQQDSNKPDLEKSLESLDRTSKNWSVTSSYMVCALMLAMVASVIAIAFGVGSFGLMYPHILMALFDRGSGQLAKANKLYEDGDLLAAIVLADAIASDSLAYDEAQVLVAQWQIEWTQLQQTLNTLETAQSQDDWATVLATAEQLPTTNFWRLKRTQFIQDAQTTLNQQGRSLLQQAFLAAYERDFVTALAYLHRISPRADVYARVPDKIAEYTQSRNVRAQYFLQQAFDRAQEREFHGALEYLRRIDDQSPSYNLAQEKIAEYTAKRDVRSQYLIQWATHRATLEDYSGAILLLQDVSVDSPVYADAQVQILFYGQHLHTSTPSGKSGTASNNSNNSVSTATPYFGAETPQPVAPVTKPTSLNPGDRLVEVVPNPKIQP